MQPPTETERVEKDTGNAGNAGSGDTQGANAPSTWHAWGEVPGGDVAALKGAGKKGKGGKGKGWKGGKGKWNGKGNYNYNYRYNNNNNYQRFIGKVVGKGLNNFENEYWNAWGQ